MCRKATVLKAECVITHADIKKSKGGSAKKNHNFFQFFVSIFFLPRLLSAHPLTTPESFTLMGSAMC